MTTADLTTQSPVEIDTALAEIYTRYYAKRAEVATQERYIKDMREGIAKFEAGNRSYSSYTEERLAELFDAAQRLRLQAQKILDETDPYDEEYVRRGRWSRFFLVTNNGGHIHRSMGCSTCFPTTQFGWLPEFSGQTEAEAVAKHGAILCTVCYPSAPTEWTNGKKPGDEDVCEGSGRYYSNDLPHRTGYYTGNWAQCPECPAKPSVSKAGKIRKHKREAAA